MSPDRKPSRRGLIGVVAAMALALVGCGGEPEAQAPVVQTEAAFVVEAAIVRGMKPAFAQVDSVDAVSARARIGGTIAELRVREGAEVARGDVIAVITDARLPLQAQAEGAQAEAVAAQLAQARSDLARYETLHADGFYPTQRLEQQRAQVRALEDQVVAARSQRAVTVETRSQGAVLAPVSGKVLRVPARRGGVVAAGEEIALVGSAYVLKLRLPERHAGLLQEGGTIDVELTEGSRAKGRVRKIYPALEDGRVEADIDVDGLADRIFGERVRVWTPSDERRAIIVPQAYLALRYGVDFARVQSADGTVHEIVVRRGEPVEAPGVANAVEILSGLAPGDRIVPFERNAP